MMRSLTVSVILIHPKEPTLLCVLHPAFRRWMFPGGRVEPEEAPHLAALREAREEVGIDASMLDMTALPRWSGGGNVRLPQPIALIEESLPEDSGRSYIDIVHVALARSAKIRCCGEIRAADWFRLKQIEELNTTYPIKELAREVLGRLEEFRKAPSIE